MAYIYPNTNVYILKNILLNNTYSDTIYFNGINDQYNYFVSKAKYRLNNYTYQRASRAYISVEVSNGNLLDCNYMMFQNEAFGEKWFYAFITETEYVNNVTSYIYFEIDVFQTWFMNICTLKPSYVVRQHLMHNGPRDQYLPETINFGNIYESNRSQRVNLFDKKAIIIIASKPLSLDDDYYSGSQPHMSGIFTNLYTYGFHYPESAIKLYGDINALPAEELDSIVNVYMIPSILAENLHLRGAWNQSHSFVEESGNIMGYVPRNKVLLQYPYKFFRLITGDGASIDFRYEYFIDGYPTFNIYGVATPDAQIAFIPTNYNNQTLNNEFSLAFQASAQCPHKNDAYKTWLAQNGLSTVLSMMSSALTSGVGIATGNSALALGGLTGLAASYVGGVVGDMKAQLQPNSTHGAAKTTVNFAADFTTVWGCQMSVTRIVAEQLDSYFDRFGQRTDRIVIPNISGRPAYNYVQIKNAIIDGNCPATAKSTMVSAFERGVTFWKYGDSVGDYSVDNTI